MCQKLLKQVKFVQVIQDKVQALFGHGVELLASMRSYTVSQGMLIGLGPLWRRAAIVKGTVPFLLWRLPRLTTSALASRIASRPTSFSGLSRPSWAAIGNFCRHMHRCRTYYLYCNVH